jgi:nucleoside-diphosphate-sugar epimerase
VRVLVTGHAGFIGSHLADALIDAGHDVVGIDDLDDYYDRRLKLANVEHLVRRGLVSHVLDLAKDRFAERLAGVEAIFHLAAQPGISATSTFDQYLANNVVATERLVAEAVKLPALRAFVHGSTSSIYGLKAVGDEDVAPQPISDYGITKLCAEQIVLAQARAGRLPACSLRLYSVYGPRERPDKALPRLIRAAILGTEFGLHEGSEAHTRSFTYVSDAVAGFVAALAPRGPVVGEVVNIGSDQETRMSRILEIVEEVSKRPLRVTRIPPRAGDQTNTRAEIGKARRLLGYHPTVSIEEGIARQYAWFEKRVVPDDEPAAPAR